MKRPHFVITIVLYFGTARRWPRRRSLQERLRVPAEYRPLVAECPVNVLELAWLTEEQEAPFKGEFRHLVHYLRQARMGQKLDFLQEPAVKHLAEFFAALRALTRDEHYDALIEQACEHWIGGEPGMKLPSLFDAAREEGIALGRSEGRESTCQMIRERLTAMGISQEIIAAATNLPPAAMEGARA